MNYELIRLALGAFEAIGEGMRTGDFTALSGHLADDVELTFFGTTRAAGTFRGKAAVLRWFSGTHHFFPEGFQFEVRNVMAGDHAVAIEWADRAVTHDGRPYQNYGVTVLEIRDGKVSAYREYMDTERIKALF